MNTLQSLPDLQQEKIAKSLKNLLARRGFQYLPMNKFEEYDLYVENKNFLAAEHIISFTDTQGKLLALKSDSTLSIAKHVPAESLLGFQKYYYQDQVFRLAKETAEYRVLDQIGVEIMGPIDTYTNVECVDIALACLAVISDDIILDISHNGFLQAVLINSGLSHRARRHCLAAIHSKSPHELERILREQALSPQKQAPILALNAASGPLVEALPTLEEYSTTPETKAAYQELESIAHSLAGSPAVSRVMLDFSAVGDADYYNGIVLRGYVQHSPNAILTGGRYDKLLTRMKKKNGALGFAISLSELQAPGEKRTQPDFDAVVYYDPSADSYQVLQAVRRLQKEGKSVRTEPLTAKDTPKDYSYGAVYTFKEKLQKEENPC